MMVSGDLNHFVAAEQNRTSALGQELGMPSMSTSPPSEVTIEGQFYSGNDSSRRGAVLRSAAGVIIVDAGDTRLRLAHDDVTISPRIGNTPATSTFLTMGSLKPKTTPRWISLAGNPGGGVAIGCCTRWRITWG